MLSSTSQGLLLSIKVIPKSSINLIYGMEAGVLKIKVTSPPDKNLANEAVILLLSTALHIPKSTIKIIKGLHSRNKIVCFCDQNKTVLEEKLKEILKKL